ncbi:MAG: GtrA family protein [Hyphomonadaceae bacterium]|nr:GtrA family protein [Hyphomonadaceae bacterium]
MALDLVRRFAATNLAQQLVRFVAVGAVATAVHYAILIALVELAGMPPVFSTTAGYAAGTVVSYVLNRRFTFKSNAPHHASFPKFVALNAIGMLLNGAIFAALISLGVWYVLAQVIATGLVLIWNFLGARFFAFR